MQVEVTSPLDIEPIGAGEIATLRFWRRLPEDEPVAVFAPWRREGLDELLLKDLERAEVPELIDPAGLFEQLDSAAFSPDGTRMLLGAVSHSRPVLLRTDSVHSMEAAESVLLSPTRTSGLDWVRQDRFMACNNASGFVHPQGKALMWGLRGGLDDLKVWSGVRDPQAFRSEAERGHEFLDAAGLGDELESRLPACENDHLQCPPFHLCVEGACELVPCDPVDPWSCAGSGGRCTLRPQAVEQEYRDLLGNDPFAWVCSADCSVDRQCFAQECLNGPCRFCDVATASCVECRNTVRQLGDLTVAAVEGCPDQRSFRCSDGACVTECYSFEDDQSRYLCDPALEYCEQGRCVLHDWDWWDLSPASFAGGSTMRQAIAPDPARGWHGETQAVDQRWPVEVVAYGVADYLTPPEVVVEVRGGPFYGGQWQRLGEVSVQARTRIQAHDRPQTVSSPRPFDELRLRLVTSPYDNVSGGATGFDARDRDFCLADLAAIAERTGEQVDTSVCFRRAQGSRYSLGYRLGIPYHEAAAACREHGATGCPPMAQAEHDFLHGGNAAVVVLDVSVDGGSVMNAIAEDKVCVYGGYDAGALVPTEGGATKKLFYGDISTEQSPERDAFCTADPEACAPADRDGLVEFDHAARGFGLLNCNVFEHGAAGDIAAIRFANIPTVREWPARAGAIVIDTGDVCTVEVDAMLSVPCYEWIGGGVSLDPHTGAVNIGLSVANEALDFAHFRSFGHDEGFDVIELPRHQASLRLTGYRGGGLRVRCGEDTVVVAGDGDQVVACPTGIKEGRRYDVWVERQPAIAHHRCVALVDDGRARMGTEDQTQDVFCATMHQLGGRAEGLTGGSVRLLGTFSFGGPGASAKETLDVGDNGAFVFATPLPAGGLYSVEVRTHPPGQRCSVGSGEGSMPDEAASPIRVHCEDVVPHTLSVSVEGLEDGTMEVGERVTGATLELREDGVYRFPGEWIVGDVYDILITDYETDPPRSCNVVEGGAGVMPDDEQIGAEVRCESLDTWQVGGQVVGLMGDGLQLALNGGETLALAPTADPRDERWFQFSARLQTGQPYAVTVRASPSGPDQECEVAGGDGVMGHADVSLVTVICSPAADAGGYTISGTLIGMAGSNLELSLNGGVQTLMLDESGDWQLGQRVGNDTRYEVTVSRQPTNPIARCFVARGEGWITDADVDDVAVVCVPATTVTVEIQRPASALSDVSAVLIRRPGGHPAPPPPLFDAQCVRDRIEPCFVDPPRWDCPGHRELCYDPGAHPNGYNCWGLRLACRSNMARLPAWLGGINTCLDYLARCWDYDGTRPDEECVGLLRSMCPGPPPEIPDPDAQESPAIQVARAPEVSLDENGTVRFTLIELDDDADALLWPGAYDLYVYVNHDGSSGGPGAPTYWLGDFGAWRPIGASAVAPVEVRFDSDDLSPLVDTRVAASGATQIDQDLRCYWTPRGTQPALPPGPTAPVVARTGEPRCVDPCVLDSPFVLSEREAVIRGAPYDLTCWADLDGDGQGSEGDFLHYAPGVTSEGDLSVFVHDLAPGGE